MASKTDDDAAASLLLVLTMLREDADESLRHLERDHRHSECVCDNLDVNPTHTFESTSVGPQTAGQG